MRWRVFGCAILLGGLLSACLPPPAPPVLKIGLVAPFEGQARYLGYDAIYAARLAVREINAAGGLDGWRVALVAYDDRAESEMARAAARNLAVDAEVVAVIGHYAQMSTESAVPIYAEAGLPLIALGGVVERGAAPVWHLAPPGAADIAWLSIPAPESACFTSPYPFPQDVPGLETWRADYVAVGPHVPEPGLVALPTYEAVYTLAAAIEAAAARGRPTRASVAAALAGVQREGALGVIAWDADGFWADAPRFAYCWVAGVPILQETGP